MILPYECYCFQADHVLYTFVAFYDVDQSAISAYIRDCPEVDVAVKTDVAEQSKL